MLGVSWQSLWQLNADLPHPDFSLQARAPSSMLCCAVLSIYCGIFLFHYSSLFSFAHRLMQPGTLLHIGRPVKLLHVRCIPSMYALVFFCSEHSRQARSLNEVAAQFGCRTETLLLLNNDMNNISAPLPPAASICVAPDSCLASTARESAASFRDQEWFRSSQTQRP
jgi:hypothetical protein